MSYENILPEDAPNGFLRWRVGTIQCDVGIYQPEPPISLDWYANATEDQRNDTWEYVITDDDRLVKFDDAIAGIDNAVEAAREAFEAAINKKEEVNEQV